MHAARLHRYDTTLEGPACSILEETRGPTISAADEVIVKIDGAALCRPDLHIIEGQFSESIPVALPFIPGHENARVIAVGDASPAAIRLSSLDRSRMVPAQLDGVAKPCPAKGGDFLGLTRDGGFAEYLLTKERSLARIPEGLSLRAVAPHAGSTAYHAVKRARCWLELGDTVVLIGLAELGQSAFPILHTLAPVHSIVVDRSEQTLGHAQELGTHSTERADHEPVSDVRQSTGGQGAAVVMDFVAEGSTPQRGGTMTRRSSASCVVGSGGRIDIPLFVDQEVTIVDDLVGTDSELGEHMELVAGGSLCQSATTRTPRSTRCPGTCGTVTPRDARYSYPEDCERQKGGGECRSSW